MYENGNLKWFSQTLMTYKDRHYHSDGHLRVSISTNTENYRLFSPPYLNIAISNNYQKSINLNYTQCLDLKNSFEQAIKSANGDDPEVVKKVKDTMVYFKFTRVENERIVKAIIQNSESDFTTVIFPLLPHFQGLVNIIKYYTDNYVGICRDLLLKSIDSEAQNVMLQIPSLIKGISSQIINTNNLDSGAVEQGSTVVTTHETETAATIEQLDQFMKTQNIKVDEIENGKVEPKQNSFGEIDSPFVKKVLLDEAGNMQLRTIEDLLDNAKMTPSPIKFMADEITRLIDSKDESFTMLPGLSEDDEKSLSYLPKLIFSVTHHNYINNGTPIPSGFPIFKYKSEVEYNELNKNIALDLFLFGGYFRSVRRKLESKIEDAHDNRSLQYFQFRMFTDPFVFGVLDTFKPGDLLSIVMGRYGYYYGLGVFDFYEEYMKGLNTPVVNGNDIELFIREFTDKVINRTPYIGELHDQNYAKGIVRLPSKNEYDLEQIINTVVPLEVSLMLGKKLEDLEIPDDVKDIFKGKPKQQPKKSTETNLQRLIRGDLINEIPEQYRDDFTKYIEDVGNNNFNFDNKFPYSEFGDDIIKVLYVWKPEEDEKLRINFNYLKTKFAEVIHTKETILAQEKEPANEDSAGWGDITFD